VCRDTPRRADAGILLWQSVQSCLELRGLHGGTALRSFRKGFQGTLYDRFRRVELAATMLFGTARYGDSSGYLFLPLFVAPGFIIVSRPPRVG
jgi:hypothetical protein